MGDGSWVMYYTGNDGVGPHYKIGRAVSADGVAWTAPGPAAKMPGFGASVLYDGAQFRAWVTDYYDELIYHKASADGVTWGPGTSAVAPGDHPSVLQEGTAFRMWYGSGATLHATSLDGLTWTTDPDSYFAGGGFSTVIVDEGIYKMWYVKTNFAGIYYATSADGRTWTEHGLSLPNGPAGSWDEKVSSPMVVRDGDVLKMWYSGIDDDYLQPYAIGYATYP